MPLREKIYFASDFHLGAYPVEESTARERRIVGWLESIKSDAKALYLMGDVFDFWFEYKTVVPRGYVRILGKLAELSDAGVAITFFKGNHDMWMFDYLKQELDATIVDDELILNLDGKSLYLHHGDGLGPGDEKYKFLKKIFRSRLCQWLFARLHPNLGIGIATRWSKHSRISTGSEELYLGDDREWLFQFAAEQEKKQHHDYYVFGHRHLPYVKLVSPSSKVVNLGEWIHYQTYAVWEEGALQLWVWHGENPVEFNISI